MRIGRFGASDTDLIFEESVEGNLIHCLQDVLTQLDRKFLIRPVSFEGIQRIERWEYPLAALREVLLNALVHRNYTGAHVQIKVFDDRISFWNEGTLPQDLTIDLLKNKHSSRPRHPFIADVCFKGGYIDAWGRGIQKIMDACREEKLPDPQIEENSGGILVTLYKVRAAGKWGAQVSARTPQVTPQVTQQVLNVLESAESEPRSRSELQKAAEIKDREHFRKHYLEFCLSEGYLELTIPDKPTSSRQKYRLTGKGLELMTARRK